MNKAQPALLAAALVSAIAVTPAIAKNQEQSGQNRLYPQIKASDKTISPAATGTLTNGVAVTGISGAASSETLYSVDIPAGTNSLTFTMSGGSGDADLYVLFNNVPTTSNYDCRPYASGNNESCDISNIQTGTYHVMVRGYSDFSDVALVVNYSADGGTQQPARRIAVAGDSITKAFAADCKRNYWFWDLLCPAGGDQLEHSWFDGSNVYSVLDRFQELDPTVVSNQTAAQSGSEMRGGDNNFATQASKIVNMAEKPNHVSVVLGGNDICNRGCTDPANCSDPLYTDAQWRQSVREGLDILMTSMPQQEDSAIMLGSVPRVQDILQAGLDLQAQNSGVDCQSMWSSYNVCRIVTDEGIFNGENLQQRHQAIAARQIRYNEILVEEAAAYNSNSNGKNPNGITVAAEYVDQFTPSAGTFNFGAEHLNGGDCFHPNVATQNLISEMMWQATPNKP